MAEIRRKRLFLIDGMSQIYRAYHAIRGLSTSKGVPTNAVYGFTMMLRKLIADEKPDYLGLALDSSAPTFRHETYDQYKATRSGMPDDLGQQIPLVMRVCEALRVPITREPGFEADDIIGTLARQAEDQGLDVVIVTNDKDLCQLVTDHVKILRTERTGVMTMIDRDGVKERLGVSPEQVVDLLGLWGDTSDNIPGAPGVGEKGARQIIEQFGSIESAFEHASEISRKTYRESLQNNQDLIRKSRELVRIRCDMPIELDLEALKFEGADRRAAYELFAELEFVLLVKEYADAAPAEPAAATASPRPGKADYTRISTAAELERFARGLAARDRFSLAMAERKNEVYGIAISTGEMNATLVDLSAIDGDALGVLRGALENGRVRKAVHDWKGALTLIDRYGFDRLPPPPAQRSLWDSAGAPGPKPVSAARIEGVEDDTLLGAYLLDPNRASHRLFDAAREYIGVEVPETIGGFDVDDSRALHAADLTFSLGPALRGKLDELGLLPVYTEIELPLVEVLFDIERFGVRIDTAALEDAGRKMEQELARLTAAIYALADREFNINSTLQLGEVLDGLNISTSKKTKTGRVSTSAEVLEELAVKYELPRLILEYREISKLKSTYVDALPRMIDPRSGRIHTTLNQALAATGRLSSNNPNLQNIPIRKESGRQIRAAFIASPGNLLMSADYSQIELRVFAHLTGDEEMTAAFKNGEDIHARTARLVFGAKTKQEESEARRLAKIVNFGVAYAVSAFGLAARTGLSRAEAKQTIENYYETFKGVRRYMEETPIKAREAGYVRTAFGRIRPVPDINNKNHILRARAEREAINAPIQGTAADIVKMAMVRLHKRLAKEKLGGRMILQVHDELLLEAPESEVEQTTVVVREEMEHVCPLSVPLVVDIGVGKNWMEAKP